MKKVIILLILLVPSVLAATKEDVREVITFSLLDYLENPSQASLQPGEIRGLINAYERTPAKAQVILNQNMQRLYGKISSRFSCDINDYAICPDGSRVKRDGPRCTFTCSQTICTDDVFQCPDGSYVARQPPTCQFAACPGSSCGNGVCESGEANNCPECNGKLCPGAPCVMGSCPKDCALVNSCSFNYNPMCGIDGVTYRNKCVAEQTGVDIAYEGACQAPCLDVWEPVCGDDGVTYSNECHALNTGTTIAYKGACETTCGNEICEVGEKAFCYGCFDTNCQAEICTRGSCPKDCNNVVCPEYYDPVCGIDGITYSNECFAAGIPISHTGECRIW